MNDWETVRKPALMKRLLDLPRYEKINMIRKAKSYRSGTDSCNSVYMGGMATSQLLQSLGGSYGKDDLDQLLTQANDAQLNKALDVCASYIETMERHPTKPCPCCGQIVDASRPAPPNHQEATVIASELKRDIWEVANQLAGYVGPNTDERLAQFLIREAEAATKLAERIVELENTRPAPAATDTGLVTVAKQHRLIRGGYRGSWQPYAAPIFADDKYETRELCERSQAEELLAAERAEKEQLQQLVKELANNNGQDVLAMLQSLKYARKLEADNAAKDVRIKAFVEYEQEAEGIKEMQLGKIEALEAKLAAAEQTARAAHETLIEINPSNYNHDDVCQLNDASVEAIFLLADILGETHGKTKEWWDERRAVLGGKP
ncbi:hypothetical protein F9K79_09910 [Ochrobactrum sp. Kaboul]|nr:hypothetical protein F9K79_09910 [Ochrobactrum sp. Kaboul]